MIQGRLLHPDDRRTAIGKDLRDLVTGSHEMLFARSEEALSNVRAIGDLAIRIVFSAHTVTYKKPGTADSAIISAHVTSDQLGEGLLQMDASSAESPIKARYIVPVQTPAEIDDPEPPKLRIVS